MAMRIAEMAALGQNSEICQHTEREDIPCQLLTPAEPSAEPLDTEIDLQAVAHCRVRSAAALARAGDPRKR